MRNLFFLCLFVICKGLIIAQNNLFIYLNDSDPICVSVLSFDSISIVEPNQEQTKMVYDICGNSYRYVKIGEQYWMAENMRCNKYDTQSNLYGNSILVSNERQSSPYYINASDKSQWSDDIAKYGYDSYLSDEQIQKLGYLYNWIAAVGFTSDEELKDASALAYERQGICPNGFHIPTIAEWNILKSFIEKSDGKGIDTAGKHLKSASGWYKIDNEDSYCFNALPSGFGFGYTGGISDIGYFTMFWSATIKTTDSGDYLSNTGVLFCDDDNLYTSGTWEEIDGAVSVRCIKN